MHYQPIGIEISPLRRYKTIDCDVSSDELKFFRLGEQRQKLKTYVHEQLNGEQTRRNEKILVKFQQQAQMRRHNYLHKFNPKTLKYQHTGQQINNSRYQSNTVNLQQERQSQSMGKRSRFAGYVPGGRQRHIDSPALIPTQKTKPPAYNYYNVLPHRSFDLSTPIKPINNSQNIQHTKYNGFSMQVDKYNHKKGYPNHSRTMSLDLKDSQKNSHRGWALKKIKEVALKKRDPLFRQKQNKLCEQKEQTECSQDSMIISQLQRRHQQSMLECERMARQLKKMRKYRRIIQQSRMIAN